MSSTRGVDVVRRTWALEYRAGFGPGAWQLGTPGSRAQAPASFLSYRDRARCLSRQGPVRMTSATACRRRVTPERTHLPFPRCSPAGLVASALTVGPRSGLVSPEGSRSPGREPGILLSSPARARRRGALWGARGWGFSSQPLPGPGETAPFLPVSVTCVRLSSPRTVRVAGCEVSWPLHFLPPGPAPRSRLAAGLGR